MSTLQQQLQEVRLQQRSKFLEKWREEKPDSTQMAHTWGLEGDEALAAESCERLIGIGDLPDLIGTSSDPRHPPINILRDGAACWLTTGLFPQELTMQLQEAMVVSEVTLNCIGVGVVMLHTAAAIDRSLDLIAQHRFPAELPQLGRTQLQSQRTAELARQIHTFQLPGAMRTRLLKLTIASGHGDFAAVSRLRVRGRPIR